MQGCHYKTIGLSCVWIQEEVQGVNKKMRRSFCLISLATNMLESWDIIHWKGGIHSFLWSTKTFLYDIREPRYKQIKMGFSPNLFEPIFIFPPHVQGHLYFWHCLHICEVIIIICGSS